MKRENKLIILVFIGYVITSIIYFIAGASAAAENKPTAVAEDIPAAIECGSCGAHVYEYWHVENINDGTPVEVCRYCYENYIENTNTENL